MSQRARRLRTAAGIACAALLAAFIPARWGMRLALVVALFGLASVWLVFTFLGLVWDFYWPPREHSPR